MTDGLRTSGRVRLLSPDRAGGKDFLHTELVGRVWFAVRLKMKTW